MMDELQGGDDSAAPREGTQEGGSTPLDLSETMGAIIVALQANGNVTKPEEIARLTYMLQHLIAHQRRQAPSRWGNHPATTAPTEPDVL